MWRWNTPLTSAFVRLRQEGLVQYAQRLCLNNQTKTKQNLISVTPGQVASGTQPGILFPKDLQRAHRRAGLAPVGSHANSGPHPVPSAGQESGMQDSRNSKIQLISKPQQFQQLPTRCTETTHSTDFGKNNVSGWFTTAAAAVPATPPCTASREGGREGGRPGPGWTDRAFQETY